MFLSGDRQEQKQSHNAPDQPGIMCALGDVPHYLAAFPKFRPLNASAGVSSHLFKREFSFSVSFNIFKK